MNTENLTYTREDLEMKEGITLDLKPAEIASFTHKNVIDYLETQDLLKPIGEFDTLKEEFEALWFFTRDNHLKNARFFHVATGYDSSVFMYKNGEDYGLLKVYHYKNTNISPESLEKYRQLMLTAKWHTYYPGCDLNLNDIKVNGERYKIRVKIVPFTITKDHAGFNGVIQDGKVEDSNWILGSSPVSSPLHQFDQSTPEGRMVQGLIYQHSPNKLLVRDTYTQEWHTLSHEHMPAIVQNIVDEVNQQLNKIIREECIHTEDMMPGKLEIITWNVKLEIDQGLRVLYLTVTDVQAYIGRSK
jgi:hypothetical protein